MRYIFADTDHDLIVSHHLRRLMVEALHCLSTRGSRSRFLLLKLSSPRLQEGLESRFYDLIAKGTQEQSYLAHLKHEVISWQPA